MNDFNKYIIDPIGVEDEKNKIINNFFDLPFFKELLDFLTTNDETCFKRIQSFIDSYCKTCDSLDQQSQLISCGVGLLNIFIQRNWVGPDISVDDRIKQISTIETRENVLKQLIVDGENVVSVVEIPEILLLSKGLLEIVSRNFVNSLPAKVWYMRCLFIQQQILEELSSELWEKIYSIISDLKNSLNDVSNSWATLYHLEFARIFMYYQNVKKSKIEINKATELLGIDISFSGALGKRTKFQTKDLAQLILKVHLKEREDLNEPSVEVSLPAELRDVKLDDDIRLDKVQYSDVALNKYPTLSEYQLAVLLGSLFQTQKSQPKDNLADEELQPLINCILDQPKVWSFRITTLLLRSKLEANHKRTVERAMMQVQVLLDCLKESRTSFEQRLKYFFISYLPPKWDIQSTLADIFVSMGSIKSALEIYERLEDWENLIMCYNILQLRHKAQEIIEKELEKNPTPKLWCLLGDATDDVSCYEKAWELSSKRSARAQRHWANFYYHRKNYAECIEHFQKSLEINSLQKKLWYRLGFATLMEEKWEISATAYRRYCILDTECFEAWNNLARCYCEMKQKYRAWRALQEALKIDYSNWKVWDNYMLVSSDLQAFDEVIKSYHEILNLKGKHLDLPILNSLVVGLKSLETKQNETEKIDKNKFRNKLLELFGRLTSQIVNDGELWFLYSEVVNIDSSENLTKKHQLLLKAHRSFIHKSNWEKNLENCNRIIYVLSKIVEVGLQTQNPDILLSCKLAVTNTWPKIKATYPDAKICEELEKNLEKLDEILKS